MTAHVPSLVFGVEAFSSVYPEAAKLLELHWDEIAPHKDLLTINPDMQVYGTLEAAGKLVVITARHFGTLVGYVVMMMHAHHHYKHALVAVDDIHFLHKDHRRGSAGVRLIAAAEAEMARRGVQIMSLRCKVEHSHGKIFERLRFAPQDIVYTKRIGT